MNDRTGGPPAVLALERSVERDCWTARPEGAGIWSGTVTSLWVICGCTSRRRVKGRWFWMF
jgi:hypothetical protein